MSQELLLRLASMCNFLNRMYLLQRIGAAGPPRLGGMSLNGNVLQSPRRDAPYAPNGESSWPYLILVFLYVS